MLEGLKEIESAHLLAEVGHLLRYGYRFVTMTCLDAGESHELLYHFDKQYQMINLRMLVPKTHSVPSISGICFAAVLIENEIKDMFGVPFEGLAIDYKGRFLLAEDAPQTPLNKNCGMKVEIRVRPSAPAAGGAPA